LIAFFVFLINLVTIVMNTPQHSYFRASALALGLAVLFYVLALSFSTSINAALFAAVAALVSGLLTPLLLCRSSCAATTKDSSVKTSRSTPQTTANPVQESGTITDAKTLYVGNLPYRANEAAIRKLFSEYGQVISVRLVKDKETGKRRGYGFVEMPEKEAQAAIAALNETEYLQRTLKVREANEKRESMELGDGEA